MRQSIIPDELFGRVNSVYRFVGWGALPIGALVGGLLADNFGLRAPFVLGAVGNVVLALVIAPVVSNRAIAQARSDADERVLS